MTTLQKIQNLTYYDGLGKLKRILVDFFSSITSLETNSVIVGKSTLSLDTQTSGTLVIGKEYIIHSLLSGDDFSNVGFVSVDIPFIATGTTPTTWTNSTEVVFQTGSVNIIFNDVDSNLKVYLDLIYEGIMFEITNEAFLVNKTYPVLEASIATILNNNKITFNNATGYFKIEVYN